MNRQYATKPDAQGFDEVRIITVPRFKTSGLSGDEWRISGSCQLLRKGKVIHEFRMANVENCAKALPYHIMTAGDEGKFYFGGGEDGKCDQEGCSESATVIYRVKRHYCNHPHEHEPLEKSREEFRGFCGRHAKRGNSSFSDSDDNYELVSGGSSVHPDPDDERPAQFGGVINLSD